MDCSPPDSSVGGISRQEYWSELPFPSPRDLSDPGIKPASPALAGRFFTTVPPEKLHLKDGQYIKLFHYQFLIFDAV